MLSYYIKSAIIIIRSYTFIFIVYVFIIYLLYSTMLYYCGFALIIRLEVNNVNLWLGQLKFLYEMVKNMQMNVRIKTMLLLYPYAGYACLHCNKPHCLCNPLKC